MSWLEHGVVHCDLKPGNVLVTAAGEPKILDFGIARLMDPGACATTLRAGGGQPLGTVPYVSPEQVAGSTAALDARSDVYALGVLLYELLAGRLPHDLDGASIAEATRIIREDDPTPLGLVDPGLRGDLETVTTRALEKEPAHRYASAAALREVLQRYLRDESTVSRRACTVSDKRKNAPRRRTRPPAGT